MFIAKSSTYLRKDSDIKAELRYLYQEESKKRIFYSFLLHLVKTYFSD